MSNVLELMKELDLMIEEHGRVKWPIPVGLKLSIPDAYATLFDISDSRLEVTHWAEDGNGHTGDLTVMLSGMEAYPDAPPTYLAKPLRAALEEALAEIEEDYGDDGGAMVERSRRLLVRLLDAYAAWETWEKE